MRIPVINAEAKRLMIPDLILGNLLMKQKAKGYASNYENDIII